MNEMLIRAARKVCDHRSYCPGGRGPCERCILEARAIIEELRDPTDEMVAEGRDVICRAVNDGSMSKNAAINDWRTKNRMRWQAMINEILK